MAMVIIINICQNVSLLSKYSPPNTIPKGHRNGKQALVEGKDWESKADLSKKQIISY